ncbi:MAG: hypothetical protein ACK4NY_09335 [Spirosomataceae bacterium]
MIKTLLLFCLPILTMAQTISIHDAQSGEPVNGAELNTYIFVDNGTPPLVPEGNVKLKWNSNKTPFNKSIYLYKNSFTVITKNGYKTDTVYGNQLAQANYKIFLVRDKVHDDYYIKLCTTKRKLSTQELQKLKSQIDVENIEVIKKKNGLYAYITPKMNDIHSAILQLKRITDYKNPLVKDPYMLHTKNSRVHFKLQFGVISKKGLETEVAHYRQLLLGKYKIDPVLTKDNFHRIVSEKTYNNFTEAQAEFLQKIVFQNPSIPAVVIAYEKDGAELEVITQLKIK